MVGKGVDPLVYPGNPAAAVGETVDAVGVAHQQAEAAVVIGAGLESIEIGGGGGVAAEVVDHQLAAAAGRGAGGTFTVVGKRTPATAGANSHPGAAGAEIAAGQQPRWVGPPVERFGFALVILVAVGDHHQRIPGVGVVGEDQKAHDVRPV